MSKTTNNLNTTTFGKTPRPYLNSDLIEAIGATYQSTEELSIIDGAKKHGPFDIIFEATVFAGGIREHAGVGQEWRACFIQRNGW